MSTVEKPRKKYGWSEEVALQHLESEDVAGEAYVDVAIQPLDDLPCQKYGGDGGSLPRERPSGRLEEILQCKARAPIAESPWTNFAAQVIKFTGARRAVPSNVPGEIRLEREDHWVGTSESHHTVYVGVPVT